MNNSNARRPNHGSPMRYVSHGQRFGHETAPQLYRNTPRIPGPLLPMQAEQPPLRLGRVVAGCSAFCVLFWALWTILP